VTRVAGLCAAEWKRKAVHAGMGLFALLLRWLTWRQAAVCALAALLFNLFAMPRIGRGIYRDAAKRRDAGIVAYPAMVLVLILLFRRDLPVAAALWAMMAFGDPAATIAGRSLGGPALPWNREKTWTGLLTNWVVAGGFAVLFFLLTGGPFAPAAGLALFLGAGVYAFCESVRSGLDDNAVAALPTALATVALAAAMARPPAPPDPELYRRIALAVAVNVAVALAMAGLRLVQRSGAVAGAAVGVLIWVFGGWRSYALLWTFFALATAATRLGYRRKAALGVAQADAGRRGAAHVFANCGVPAALAVFHAPPIVLAAAFGAALADTLGTEIGALYGRRALSPLNLAARPAGAPGAISWPGTLAGLAGAALVGAAAVLLGLVPAARIWVVAAAGLLGSLAESALFDLGARRGFRPDHEFANAFNTFVGATAALEIALSLDAGRLYLPFGGA
jgi:uncharacterized protein (TIGR00297 family)